MTNANFRKANLGAADLSWVRAEGADFSKAILSWTVGYGGNWSHAKFLKANITLAQFTGASFKNADFSKAILQHVNLSQTNLSGALFVKTRIDSVNTDNAIDTPTTLMGRN